MGLVRGGWPVVVAMTLTTLLPATARGADPATASLDGPALPHGISLGRSGRYYQDLCDHDLRFHCLTKRLLPETYRPLAGNAGGSGAACACSANHCGGGASSPPAGAMTPGDVLAAYQVPASSSAAGKIVAIVDMPDSNALADLNVYRKAFGIPALPQCPGSGLPDPSSGTPCFAAVDESGAVTSSAGDCPLADGETGLDAEMVSAACPDCSIVLVQMTGASTDSGPQDVDFVGSAKAAIKLGAVAISISFGGAELSDPTGQDYTTPGHLVLAAAGDAGYLNLGLSQGGGTPSYPSSAPDVLAVGGTTLELKGGTYGEVAWNDGAMGGAGGSGCSTEFPMPAFQTQYLSANGGAFGKCTKRASVDVSAAAEFVSGRMGAIAEYDAVDGWLPVVGTSASAPMLAGLFTRLGLTGPISANLGWVYDHSAAFNDVTSGNNDVTGACTDVLCTAGKGWDGPTGVGTPNGPGLAALAIVADGGAAGADGGSGTLPGSKGGCGCRVGGAAEGAPIVLLLGGGTAVLARRRRRSREC